MRVPSRSEQASSQVDRHLEQLGATALHERCRHLPHAVAVRVRLERELGERRRAIEVARLVTRTDGELEHRSFGRVTVRALEVLGGFDVAGFLVRFAAVVEVRFRGLDLVDGRLRPPWRSSDVRTIAAKMTATGHGRFERFTANVSDLLRVRRFSHTRRRA